ncbi:hypothetical protein PSHT_12660 [Puccinia striiformis]|uniref:Uncharacterized protein n=2 Tax=Puccinia striiformis TaxID=27350 RepID=A0A2S4UV86_9BASI|nr:hypothetical protein PSHT_12660 [Puccinia striiformis]POW03506.1 hypothetical protein PSTT_11014 [Puccinia striiformis]
MATKRFPAVTTMCSEQINILVQLVGQPRVHPSSSRLLKSRFDYPLLVVTNHLIASIPDIDRLQDREYLKNWFMSWDTELTFATEKLIQVAALLDHDPA